MAKQKAKAKTKTAKKAPVKKPDCGHANLHSSEEIKCTLLKGHKGNHKNKEVCWSDMAGKRVEEVEVKHSANIEEEHDFEDPSGPIASDRREPLSEGE